MISADTRAAADFAIAEAFKRMAPDDYKPVPDAPVPMDSFNPRHQSEAAAARCALADGDFSSYGGGEMQPKRNGESDTERVRAQVAGKSAAASTQSPLKDEQPRRAASPIPGTYTHTPGA